MDVTVHPYHLRPQQCSSTISTAKNNMDVFIACLIYTSLVFAHFYKMDFVPSSSRRSTNHQSVSPTAARSRRSPPFSTCSPPPQHLLPRRPLNQSDQREPQAFSQSPMNRQASRRNRAPWPQAGSVPDFSTPSVRYRKFTSSNLPEPSPQTLPFSPSSSSLTSECTM